MHMHYIKQICIDKRWRFLPLLEVITLFGVTPDFGLENGYCRPDAPEMSIVMVTHILL